MKYVLDSYALLSYCEGEGSGIVVKDILKKASEMRAEIFVSVVNWGEMFYIALREGGTDRAEQYKEVLSNYPISIIDADKPLTLIAAKYKAFHKISYADAYAAALSETKKATLLTGDKEFRQLRKAIKIKWLE